MRITGPGPAALRCAELGGSALALLLASCLCSAGAVAAASRELCFQQLRGQPGRQDIEQLQLETDGSRVKGFYRWIPWQKDRRVGVLEGRLSAPGLARVLYRFQQEGQAASAPLSIAFSDRWARIDWDQPAASSQALIQPMPTVQLPRQACGRLKPVPGL